MSPQMLNYKIAIMATHLPVVILLATISWQVYKSLNISAFKFFSLAWIPQLFHVIISLFITIHFSDDTISDNNLIVFWADIGKTCVDLISSYIFLIASYYGVRDNFDLKKYLTLRRIFVCIVIISLILLTKYFCKEYHQEGFGKFAVALTTSTFSFYCLFELAKYFKDKFNNIEGREYLYYGTILYGVLQFLTLLSLLGIIQIVFFGYFFSLIFKVLMLFGIQIILINMQQVLSAEKKQLEDRQEETERTNKELNRILGRTYHEITSPIRTIRSRLEELLHTEKELHQIRKNTRRELEVIELNYHRLIAVISASMKMYEEGIGTGFDTETFNIPRNDDTLGVNNVNTLIEIAIISLKDIMYDEESVKISREYAGGCDIACYPVELTQVFFNIMKNSYDAFFENEGEIFIRTKILKEKNDTSGKFKKYIRVELADNGSGINENIISLVLQEGFSTKGQKDTIRNKRGYGLSIVNDILKRNQGTISLESPYEFSDFNNRQKQGTLVTIIFPIS